MSGTVDGQGALLILPGLLCDGRMFAAQIQRFPAARAIGAFYGRAATIEAMAEHVLALAPPRFAMLGHSMGARVALEVIRRAPERVARLALADTGIHPVREAEREARHRLRDLGRAEGAAALVDAWLPGMVATPQPQVLATLRAMAIDAGLGTYERQIAALLARPPVEEVLATISCPTLVCVGAEDRWSPVGQHRDIAARIAGARLRIVPDAGHMAPAEQPAAFNDAVAEWLGWGAAA